LPVTSEFVGVSLGVLTGGLGGLLDFLAVFIEAGEVKCLPAKATLRPRDDVGDYLFLGMPKVRLAIHVINGGGDVKLLTQRAACCS